MSDRADAAAPGRITMGLLGFLGGAATWLLVHVLPDMMADNRRLLLFLGALSAGFFPAALALMGPLRARLALPAAAALALPLAGLMVWASLRFDTVGAFVKGGSPWVFFALLLFLMLPFAIAALGRGTRWSDYGVLFTQSWMIVVRFAASWLFVGLVWGVLFLSNALLELVGIDLIERLMTREEVPFLLSGLTLGVALAVVGELSDYVSPDLILRLLRLLVPVVLVVVSVFLVALPFRGLSNLFGEFSAAATLLAMAFGAATLVSTGIDAEESRRVPGGLICWACRLMALLLPALAGLAGVAIWQRVSQYGLSPDRIVSGALAALAMGYGLAYAASVLRGRGWAERVRRANVVMALVAMATLAALLTPVLDPQRMSAANQVARFAAGQVGADDLDLWTIGRDWGRAGQRALDRLAAMEDHPGAGRLAERLAALQEAESRYAFERMDEQDDLSVLAADLRDRLPVRPEGARVPSGLFESLRLWEVQRMNGACARRTPSGNPGCVAVVADFSGLRDGDEVLIVAADPEGGSLVRAYFRNADGPGYAIRSPDILAGADFFRDVDAAVDALLAGDYRLVPVPLHALEVEGRTLFFGR